MGFYLNGFNEFAHNKAALLIEKHGAERISHATPSEFINPSSGRVMVCVVANFAFEAAGVAFDEAEFKEFSNPRDDRPKEWLSVDRKVAEGFCPGLASQLASQE